MNGFAGLYRSSSKKPETSTSAALFPNLKTVCAAPVAGSGASTGLTKPSALPSKAYSTNNQENSRRSIPALPWVVYNLEYKKV